MIAVVDIKVKQKMVAIILHASATTLNLMPRSYIHEETPVVAPIMREEEGPALTTTVSPLTIFYDGKRGRRDARRGAKGAADALLKEAWWLAREAAQCGRRCGLMEVKRRERRAAYLTAYMFT
jgi:hypothetical protein